MFKRLLSPRWHRHATPLLCLMTGLIVCSSSSVRAEIDRVAQVMTHSASITTVQPVNPLSDPKSDFAQPTLSEDPLNSAYPIPWNWIVQTQAEFTEKGGSGLRYYRSPALVSPDGQYAAYTRIQLQAESELYRSRVNSVVFLENLQTGKLQVLRATSPLADHLSEIGEGEEIPGIVSILMPVSWSANGERLLARQFEGFLSTSDATDYAVIWERAKDRTTTLSPDRTDYTTSILLGWSNLNPDRVLFRAGVLGEEEWPLWSVALNGQTAVASEDESIVYGQKVIRSWTGVQALH